MTKPRDEFVALLNESRACAWLMAEHMTAIGYNVRIIPATTTPNEEDRFEHADIGDLEVVQRCEIKHWPKINFKSLDEVPYPEVIVDEAYKITNRHVATLFGYIIINASKTGAIFLSSKTRKFWYEKRMHDRREKADRTFMVCPKEHWAYRQLGS